MPLNPIDAGRAVFLVMVCSTLIPVSRNTAFAQFSIRLSNLDDWSHLASQLSDATETAFQAERPKFREVLVSAEMARELQVAMADHRRDRRGRIAAFEQHEQLLRSLFRRVEAQSQRNQDSEDRERFAEIGCKLSESCAALADEVGDCRQCIASLKTRIKWADLWAKANLNHYRTDSGGWSLLQDLAARSEPALARIDLARTVGDWTVQRQQWMRLREITLPLVEKTRALNLESAAGGEDHYLAAVEHALAWADAELAHACGDCLGEVQYRQESLRWSRQMVVEFSASFELRISNAFDVWCAHRSQAEDRIALARLNKNPEAGAAREDLLSGAASLYERVRRLRSNSEYRPSEIELLYAQCAVALAETGRLFKN